MLQPLLQEHLTIPPDQGLFLAKTTVTFDASRSADQPGGAIFRYELTPQQYSAWIKPLTAVTFDPAERRLRVGAPNRFKLDWVKDQFASRIETIAQAYFERPVQLEVEGPAVGQPGQAVRPGQDGETFTRAGGRYDPRPLRHLIHIGGSLI